MAEVFFLTLVGAFFTYLLLESWEWPLGAAFLPRLVTGLGLVLLVFYIVSRVRQTDERGKRTSRILDVGFTDAGLDRQVILARMARFFGSTAALFLGVWLVGFHIALPVYVFLYLFIYGRVRWWWAFAAALSFEAALVGLYDQVLHTSWNEPVLLKALGVQG